MIDIAKEELDIDIKKKLLDPTISWFRANRKKVTYSMNDLYKTIGISKQAVHRYAQRASIFDKD